MGAGVSRTGAPVVRVTLQKAHKLRGVRGHPSLAETVPADHLTVVVDSARKHVKYLAHSIV
jgi:hypothetical protein